MNRCDGRTLAALLLALALPAGSADRTTRAADPATQPDAAGATSRPDRVADAPTSQPEAPWRAVDGDSRLYARLPGPERRLRGTLHMNDADAGDPTRRPGDMQLAPIGDPDAPPPAIVVRGERARLRPFDGARVELRVRSTLIGDSVVRVGWVRPIDACRMALNSPLFKPGRLMGPVDGAGCCGRTSPPLAWKDLPRGTKELVLVVESMNANRDRAGRPPVTWLVYGIPASAKGLAANIPRGERVKTPVGAAQGVNSFGEPRYCSENPYWNQNDVMFERVRYVYRHRFRLYALDAPLSLKPGATREQLRKAMTGHVLGTADLFGVSVIVIHHNT